MATSKKSSKEPLSIDAISNLLDTKLTSLDSKLESKMASLEDKLESKMASLESKMASLENTFTTKMSELEGAVKSLDTKFQSQAADIQRHEDKLETLEKLIVEKACTLEELDKKIEKEKRKKDTQNAGGTQQVRLKGINGRHFRWREARIRRCRHGGVQAGSLKDYCQQSRSTLPVESSRRVKNLPKYRKPEGSRKVGVVGSLLQDRPY
ncbi:uncharacterized protein LOC132383189 [Hypanus sabinus]|uniref:uncharacterized protein LOC132383189 n=1 Tax=Hypanus sabinus TaxID=79690 RepID=UPI0028C47936|nr:uncharacterized protein LOC132383189 [Hypanus sabinus]